MHDFTAEVLIAAREFEEYWRAIYPNEEPRCEHLKRLFRANKAYKEKRSM